MRKDLQDLRDRLQDLAEAEATYLYRLAWRMERHNCNPENIRKVREEARCLHMTGYPERLVTFEEHYHFEYAFKIR